MVRKIFIFLLAFLVIAVLISFTPSPGECSWDFQHSIWGPGWLLVQGQPPYQLTPPYGPYIAPWWPQIIGVTFWMGWLPCWTAAKTWLLVELIGLGFSVWLLNGRKIPSPLQLGVILLAVFLFPPIYTHFHLGQFSLLFIAIMTLVFFYHEEDYPYSRQPWWVPLLLVLGASKPQLTILIYPGLLAATYRKQKWKGVIRLGAISAGWLVLCLAPIFVFYPGWINGFVESTLYNLRVSWALPTLYFQLTYQLGNTGRYLWFVLCLAAIAGSVWLWLRKGARVGLLWSMAMTPLATAYTSSWDFTLLLPLFIWLFLKLRSGWARIALLAGMLAVDVLQIAARLGKAEVADTSQWWIPPALLASFLAATLIERWAASRTLRLDPSSFS